MLFSFRRWVRPVVALGTFLVGAGACRADDLTEKVLTAFRSQASELRVFAKTDDQLQVDGPKGPFLVYLYNVRKTCTSSKEQCEAEVLSFVQGVVSVASSDHLAGAFVAERTYPVLRPAGFGKRATETSKAEGNDLIVFPFVDGIELLFVVDGDKTSRFINRRDLTLTGLDEKALGDLAMHNAARLSAPKYEPVKAVPGMYFMQAADGLGTSRAFAPAMWDRLETEAGGPVAMAVPTRDWIVFCRADQPELVARMREVVGRIARGEAYAVAAVVLTREGTSWKALPAQ